MSAMLAQMVQNSCGISETAAKAAFKLQPRELGPNDPLYDLIARCSYPSTGLRLLGSGTGGTCFALQTDHYPGLTECAVKVCFAMDHYSWFETSDEARVYKLLSCVQGQIIPTILDYVECKLICSYREPQRRRYSYAEEPSIDLGCAVRARVLVMKEVGESYMAPKFQLSSFDIEHFYSDLFLKLAKVMAIGQNFNRCWKEKPLQERNIIIHDGRPLIIDLGKWRVFYEECKPWQNPSAAAGMIEVHDEKHIDRIRRHREWRLTIAERDAEYQEKKDKEVQGMTINAETRT